MHRDLKPANIICRDNYGVVIVDFGFACKISNDDSLVLHEKIGTPLYMSPELLNRKKYNSKSDIWSLGVIYYEMQLFKDSLHFCQRTYGLFILFLIKQKYTQRYLK